MLLLAGVEVEADFDDSWLFCRSPYLEPELDRELGEACEGFHCILNGCICQSGTLKSYIGAIFREGCLPAPARV
jgi:hypothetical protein